MEWAVNSKEGWEITFARKDVVGMPPLWPSLGVSQSMKAREAVERFPIIIEGKPMRLRTNEFQDPPKTPAHRVEHEAFWIMVVPFGKLLDDECLTIPNKCRRDKKNALVI